MTMPETAMNKNDRVPTWENYVRFSWEIAAVALDRITHAPKELRRGFLRQGILAADSGHVPATALGSEKVRHIHSVRPTFRSTAWTRSPMARAISGGTAFPTCLY